MIDDCRYAKNASRESHSRRHSQSITDRDLGQVVWHADDRSGSKSANRRSGKRVCLFLLSRRRDVPTAASASCQIQTSKLRLCRAVAVGALRRLLAAYARRLELREIGSASRRQRASSMRSQVLPDPFPFNAREDPAEE
jgi:hypothetical protein